MDGLRDYPSDFDLPSATETSAAADVAAAIGQDERRMHVRAYNYWVSLLDGRDYPSIEDLEPGDVTDFADHSVLLDFTSGGEDPATPYIGTAIRAECGLSETIKSIADVPSRSLLSRLTDQYMQIIANRAPVGFEAEFVNQRGAEICYRGILMPFSSDGETIDFIYGVINWKEAGADAAAASFAPQPLQAVEEDEDVLELDTVIASPDPHSDAPHLAWEDGPLADDADEPAIPEVALDDSAGLADWLCAARETAEVVKSADHRSRAALYSALSQAFDFAIAAEREPESYAELLEDSGVKAQARAPMTPVVKLVFGIDYDKTRLTEFAAALSFAKREGIGVGGFKAFIETQAGGLKALVAAERAARRPEPKEDTRGDRARAKLRSAQPISLDTLPADEEFALVLVRRRLGGGGGHEAVALVDDQAMVERAIRRAA